MSELRELLEFFNNRKDGVVASYETREGRNKFAAKLVTGKQVLNLGSGGKRHLEKFLHKSQKCFDVDFSGDCDLLTDLDTVNQLPFEAGSFDTVCALDVLEHLNNFHLINEEMFRVSRKNIIVSLPNDASNFFENILRNKPNLLPADQFGLFSKYHGLPIENPPDRHKWWLTFWDIVRYYKLFVEKRGLQVSFVTNPMSLRRLVIEGIIGPVRYHNLFSSYLWVLMKK
jgi:hypothetical protein